MPRPDEIPALLAQARSAKAQATHYIARHPASSAVPVLVSLRDNIERMIGAISHLTSTNGDKT